MKGIVGKNNIDYVRLMNHFDKDSDLKIKHLYGHIQKNPLKRGDTLTTLYRGEIVERQKEFWEKRSNIILSDSPPYSVDELFSLE